MAGEDEVRWISSNQAGMLMGKAYGDNLSGGEGLLRALAAGL